MDNIYNCRVYIEMNRDEILNVNFISIAKDEYELAEKIKDNILNRTILDEYDIDMEDIIQSYENFYTEDNELYANIEAIRLFENVDLKQLRITFDDVVQSSYKGIDILDKIKQLVIGYRYFIKYVKKGTKIYRDEILYYGDDTDYYSYKEISDYEKNGINKFNIGDKVKITYLEDSPIFEVVNCPTPICECIDWSNVYELQYADIDDSMRIINVHESELERIEEDMN